MREGGREEEGGRKREGGREREGGDGRKGGKVCVCEGVIIEGRREGRGGKEGGREGDGGSGREEGGGKRITSGSVVHVYTCAYCKTYILNYAVYTSHSIPAHIQGLAVVPLHIC